MANHTLFGISEAGWKTIDVVSLSFILTINAAKLLGLNKRTKKYKQLGLRNQTWNKVNTTSDVLLIFTLLRGLVDSLEEYDVLIKRDAVFPGRGIIPEVVVNAAKGLKTLPAQASATAGRAIDNFF